MNYYRSAVRLPNESASFWGTINKKQQLNGRGERGTEFWRHAVKVKVCCWWVSELPISSVSARARRSVPVSANPTTQGYESHNFASSSMSSTQIDYLGVAFSRMVTHWTMKCCCTIVSYDLRLATDFQPACWRDIALQISWGLDAKHCVCYLAANAKFTRAGRFPANPPFQQLAA